MVFIAQVGNEAKAGVGKQHGQDEDNGDGAGGAQAEALEAFEDEDGDDLGVVGEDGDGAKFADAAGPHHHCSGGDAAPGLGQGDMEEDLPGAGAVDHGRFFHFDVDGGEGFAAAGDQEGKSNEEHGNDDAGDAVNEEDADLLKGGAEDAAAAKDHQQGDAGGGMGDDDGQGNDAFDNVLAGELTAGEYPGEGHTDERTESSGDDAGQKGDAKGA